jgi:hypothetical protein
MQLHKPVAGALAFAPVRGTITEDVWDNQVLKKASLIRHNLFMRDPPL